MVLVSVVLCVLCRKCCCVYWLISSVSWIDGSLVSSWLIYRGVYLGCGGLLLFVLWFG